MADTEERLRKREERRQRRKEKNLNDTNDKVIQEPASNITLNGDPDISRETEERIMEQKSDAALPDVVKVPSGLNENWDKQNTDDDAVSGRNDRSTYDNVDAHDPSSRQQQRDATFEPEVSSAGDDPVLAATTTSDSLQSVDDDWSKLAKQGPPVVASKPVTPQSRVRHMAKRHEGDYYTEDELRQIDASDGEPAGRDAWRSRADVAQSRGVNKPPIKKKEDYSWIKEIPKLPEDPIPQEPPWLDLVRKRRWKSTVKARFPQDERERIQFERRLDTSKKGLKYNPRGEPMGIVGPDMDDELSLFLLQQRRRIESDSVFETSRAPGPGATDRSFSDSDYNYGDFTFDQDPHNRELAAAKGILNLSHPPLVGPKKELHKNLAMERSRQSTMKWRFSIDPHEDPIWTKLPRPDDISALDELEGNLGSKYWSNKMKFQKGQFDPPPVKPKPRSRSSSTNDAELTRNADELRTRDMSSIAPLSAVKDMRQKLAAGEFKTSTPLPKRDPEFDESYVSRLRDIQQRLTDKALEAKKEEERPNYISQEELASIESTKKAITADTFKEKIPEPKPKANPTVKRSRSNAELFDLLASRKQQADANTVGVDEEIANVASDITKELGKLSARDEIEQERQKYEEQRALEKSQQEKEKQKRAEEDAKRQEEQRREEEKKRQLEEERKQREVEEQADLKDDQESELPPEFLVSLKDCEVEEGSDLSLEVVLSGVATIQWYRDDQLIGDDGKRCKIVHHGFVHNLNISGVQMEDEGIYECVATNSSGKATCDCEVLVND